MLKTKFLTEDQLFDTLGDFSLELIEVMADDDLTPRERAKWLSEEVEGLTKIIWANTPRLGEITPSQN